MYKRNSNQPPFFKSQYINISGRKHRDFTDFISSIGIMKSKKNSSFGTTSNLYRKQNNRYNPDKVYNAHKTPEKNIFANKCIEFTNRKYNDSLNKSRNSQSQNRTPEPCKRRIEEAQKFTPLKYNNGIDMENFTTDDPNKTKELFDSLNMFKQHLKKDDLKQASDLIPQNEIICLQRINNELKIENHELKKENNQIKEHLAKESETLLKITNEIEKITKENSELKKMQEASRISLRKYLQLFE